MLHLGSGLPCGSDSKESACQCRSPRSSPWVGKIPWRRAWQPSILVWRIPWTEEAGGAWTSPDGQHRNQIDYILCSQRWRSSTQSAKTRPGAVAQTMNSLFGPWVAKIPGEGNGYPLQYTGLENSMDCIVHRVTKSQTQLSDFHFTFIVQLWI